MGRGGALGAGLLEVQFRDKLNFFSNRNYHASPSIFFPSPIPFLIVICFLGRAKGPSLLAGRFVYFTVGSWVLGALLRGHNKDLIFVKRSA